MFRITINLPDDEDDNVCIHTESNLKKDSVLSALLRAQKALDEEIKAFQNCPIHIKKSKSTNMTKEQEVGG